MRPLSDQPASLGHARPMIALLPWGNLIEDFLEALGISLHGFCEEFTGSWIFGYVEALRRVGVDTAIIVISAQVAHPTSYVHRPTNVPIWVLPAPAPYLALRRLMRNPYGRTVARVFGPQHGLRRVLIPALAALRELAPYLATPPRALAQTLRALGCVAVLCQEYEYARFDVALVVGQRLGLPVFASFQGGNTQRSRLERLVRRHSLRASAGLIIAPANERARVAATYGVSPARLSPILNPVDLARWQPMDRAEARAMLGIPAAARVAVWHGRVLLYRKGLDVLATAWAHLCRERPGRDLRLLLIGSGPDEAALRVQLAALPGVTWHNRFVSDREMLRCYLSAADVYAFPSRHEGFPVAPIEAMACGLPVVAAAASGIPDLLAGGVTAGGLVVPCDAATPFARALGLLLDVPELRQVLGRRARRRVEAICSLEAVGAQLRRLLIAPTPKALHEVHNEWQ